MATVAAALLAVGLDICVLRLSSQEDARWQHAKNRMLLLPAALHMSASGLSHVNDARH